MAGKIMEIGFAVKKLIPPGSNDPRIKPRMGILHVADGNSDSLYDYFKNRSGGIESHTFIQTNGGLEQYRDTEYQADANLDANDFAISVETQGYAAGKWSDDQLDTIKRLMLWCHRHHKIPLRVVESWDDPKGGWGYHTLFGAPSHWTPVAKSCPGPNRIKQFNNILVPWMKLQGDDMFTPEDSRRLEAIETGLEELRGELAKAVVQIRVRDKRTKERIANKFGITIDKLNEILTDIQEN